MGRLFARWGVSGDPREEVLKNEFIGFVAVSCFSLLFCCVAGLKYQGDVSGDASGLRPLECWGPPIHFSSNCWFDC